MARRRLEVWRVRAPRWPWALGASKARSSRPSAETRRIRELERELARKEKALAEAAALLLLEKKAQALWGAEDDTTALKKGRRS